ncbi:MAG TPA: family 20 glycosylhydrolase [Ktedonobacteraceae bacterium]|nr:family 20 glycosylhydrolase [Ktedonobacteraceae bacterium]
MDAFLSITPDVVSSGCQYQGSASLLVARSEQEQHILGAQCNLWSEYVSTTQHLEYLLFPRAIALSEVVWTPKERLAFSDFRERLAMHEARLASLNVYFRPVAKLDQEPMFPAREQL